MPRLSEEEFYHELVTLLMDYADKEKSDESVETEVSRSGKLSEAS